MIELVDTGPPTKLAALMILTAAALWIPVFIWKAIRALRDHASLRSSRTRRTLGRGPSRSREGSE